jgi:endoglucanase
MNTPVGGVSRWKQYFIRACALGAVGLFAGIIYLVGGHLGNRTQKFSTPHHSVSGITNIRNRATTTNTAPIAPTTLNSSSTSVIAAPTVHASTSTISSAPHQTVPVQVTTTTTAPLVAPKLPPDPIIRVAGNKLVNGQGNLVQLRGVDASGTEDACVQGNGYSYDPSTPADAEAIAAWGANAVRVPLNEDCWLGINGVPSAFAGAAYRSFVERWVSEINEAGLVAILDLHWSAPGSYIPTQQWPMADSSHSITFWSQVATEFRANPSVIFDLFNEPFLGGSHPSTADWSCWLSGCATSFTCTTCSAAVGYQTAGMQQLLNAVREAGAVQPVMVGGLNYSGDPCGIYDDAGNSGSCAWNSYEPNDPLHQLIVSFHTYNWSACNTLACWNSNLVPLAESIPIVTGEFGETDCATGFIGEFMDWANEHNISYLAWSWEPPPTANKGSCIASTGGDDTGTNLELLSNWQGDPSTSAPQGSFIRNRLLETAQ